MQPPSSCWHSCWAEIKIRRSSGNTAWMMRLENRPFPLSVTHPSSLAIPESELGLLAGSFPPDGGVKVQNNSQDVKKSKDEQEFFFSREVGSFTDISFASNIPDSLSKGAEVRKERPSTNTGPVTIEAVKEEVNDEMETSEDIDGMERVEEEEESADEKPDLLSISETAALLDSSSDLPTEQNELGRRGSEISAESGISEAAPDAGSSSAIPATSEMDPSALPAHVKREFNSQSWSENVESSPVPITPRASSYSFSTEHLPPLLSYDGGEDFGHSPSLHEGGLVMSEEEQVI